MRGAGYDTMRGGGGGDNARQSGGKLLTKGGDGQHRWLMVSGSSNGLPSMVSARGRQRRSRAICRCIGGGWVRMVVAGEVGKDKAAAGVGW